VTVAATEALSGAGIEGYGRERESHFRNHTFEHELREEWFLGALLAQAVREI
jgi:hypothetical protein